MTQGDLFEQYARARKRGDFGRFIAIHEEAAKSIRDVESTTRWMDDFDDVPEPDIKVLSLIAEVLPHGSGVNYDWKLGASSSSLILSNEFDVIDEDGFYVGAAKFTIKIPRDVVQAQMKDPGAIRRQFTLEFNGHYSSYLNRRYHLREYLDDLFADAFGQLKAFGK